MYFQKYCYASNFEYVSEVAFKQDNTGALTGRFSTTDYQPQSENPYQQMPVEVTVSAFEGDIYRLQFQSSSWPKSFSQSELTFPEATSLEEGATKLQVNEKLELSLQDAKGNTLLQSVQDYAFGVGGNSSIFQFARRDEFQYYGMGEKMFGMELSGVKTKFWNTDVWGDFPGEVFVNGRPDPLYVSVPYLIIKQDNTYIGLLLDNPYATYMATDSRVNIAGQKDAECQPEPAIVMGAEHGQPNLVIIYGPTLAELTRKLQTIVGVTPMPPAWALGYHQCRWGYKSHQDLVYLNAGMDRNEIPCDGLWLDIEYMDGYRVFTFDDKNFPEPPADIADIQKNGRRIIPIIDPGVKAESGYEVYESGHAEDVFCKNPQGQEYIGLVWPGETVFPDYSTEKGRTWWAKQVKAFAETGITGAWLDMNDPSTGRVACIDMLFNDGKDSHYTYHNQFATGMSRASRDGFQQARPNERVFLLSRSGYTGTSKYAAIWTGDNVSNYHYLKGSVSCTLNLALSGIPFNGPDVGGFGSDTTPQLLRDWTKAGFLFPFCRNHSIINSQNQEPWAFDNLTLKVVREYIQLRYRLRPYLYNLFVAQEETGEAIMRPLFYEFDDGKDLPLGYIDDQFMVGSYIMQAPFLEENQQEREVVLPDTRWFALEDSEWIDGNCKVSVTKQEETTPMYIRKGAIIPVSTTPNGDHAFEANKIDCHLFVDDADGISGDYVYTYDDGLTLDYQQGVRSRTKIAVTAKGGKLEITTEQLEDGFGPCEISFVVHGECDTVALNGKQMTTTPESVRLAGVEHQVARLS